MRCMKCLNRAYIAREASGCKDLVTRCKFSPVSPVAWYHLVVEKPPGVVTDKLHSDWSELSEEQQ